MQDENLDDLNFEIISVPISTIVPRNESRKKE